ncbi:MAG TPA: hypothetical protein VJN72_06240, partial [Gaiellales bacterium]|nr:hypothetical protein [Gaiellales bacterium]
MSSLSIVPSTGVELMTPADEAHRRLRLAFDRIEADYWALTDAHHRAHESEAWLRDDRAHEQRYRRIMADQNFSSIFYAYIYDEFGIREGVANWHDVAGRLRAAVDISPTRVGEISTAARSRPAT